MPPPLPYYRAQGPQRLLPPSGTALQLSPPQCHVSEAEAFWADAGVQWAVGDRLEKGGPPQGDRPAPRSAGGLWTLGCLRPAGGAAAQSSGRDPRWSCLPYGRCHCVQSRSRALGPTSMPPPGGGGGELVTGKSGRAQSCGHLDTCFSLDAVTP